MYQREYITDVRENMSSLAVYTCISHPQSQGVCIPSPVPRPGAVRLPPVHLVSAPIRILLTVAVAVRADGKATVTKIVGRTGAVTTVVPVARILALGLTEIVPD